jgi:RimJ/RimL family protein N-acetyltransferase
MHVDSQEVQTLNDMTKMGASPNIPRPESAETQEEFINFVKNGFLHVVICLAPPGTTAPSTSSVKPIPIGTMGLNRDTNLKRIQHRNASIGLRILADYRGQGYGTEAIKWVVDYGFRRAGLHKIKIDYFGHNEKAGKLYQRLGFVEEGRLRDELWHDGKWWEMVEMGMLEEDYWGLVTGGKW